MGFELHQATPRAPNSVCAEIRPPKGLSEDPNLIREWFRLVQNTVAKYGIDQADMFNFDETGFMMGVILPTMISWSRRL
jgi:hypothetical protein